tara:strand:- start:334 stop:585 length:252 start_codon:yes stop_codon:yes gene_type:complete
MGHMGASQSLTLHHDILATITAIWPSIERSLDAGWADLQGRGRARARFVCIVAPQSCKRAIFKSKKTINQINDLQYLVFFAKY